MEYVEDCYHITPCVIVKGMDEKRADISFWTERENGGLFLFAAAPNCEAQRIELEEFFSPIIDRTYFRCECGRRAFKLYLPPHKTLFKCRPCYKLRYILTTFNPNTEHGRARYQFIRMEKLSQQRMEISKPMYKGRYTTRFLRFLRLCGRAGLSDVVDDARKLMETIHAPVPTSTI